VRGWGMRRTGCSAGCGSGHQPKDSSSGDSRGVPQTRQMTAEQSPQTRGSSTERAQMGHHRLRG
jgi:hypothetical protein